MPRSAQVKYGGGGRCTLLTLRSSWMMSVGVPFHTVVAAVNGELTFVVEEKTQWLRAAIEKNPAATLRAQSFFATGETSLARSKRFG